MLSSVTSETTRTWPTTWCRDAVWCPRPAICRGVHAVPGWDTHHKETTPLQEVTVASVGWKRWYSGDTIIRLPLLLFYSTICSCLFLYSYIMLHPYTCKSKISLNFVLNRDWETFYYGKSSPLKNQVKSFLIMEAFCFITKWQRKCMKIVKGNFCYHVEWEISVIM